MAGEVRLDFPGAQAAAERIGTAGHETASLGQHGQTIAGGEGVLNAGDPGPQIKQWYTPQSANLAQLLGAIGADLTAVGERTREAMAAFDDVDQNSAARIRSAGTD